MLSGSLPRIPLSTWTSRRRHAYRGWHVDEPFPGKLRPDLGVCDRISWEFVRRIWLFRRKQGPRILKQLASYRAEVIVVTRRRDVRRLLEAIRKRLNLIQRRPAG